MTPIVEGWIDSASLLVAHQNSGYKKIGTSFANQLGVRHTKRQYTDGKTGARSNAVEAVNAVVQRAQISVYHHERRKHLQRYLDDINLR